MSDSPEYLYMYMYVRSQQTKMMNFKNNAFQTVSTHQSSWITLLVCIVAIFVTSAYGQIAIHDGHYYVSNNNYLGWQTAAAACRDDGGYLVSINTPEEQTFVHAFHTISTDQLRVWIGLQCELGTSCDGAHWEDGTALNYTAWWKDRGCRPRTLYRSKQTCQIIMYTYSQLKFEVHVQVTKPFVCTMLPIQTCIQ